MTKVKMPLKFPFSSDITTINNAQLKGKYIGVCTEDKGCPVRNLCTVCSKSYYYIVSLNNTSAMSSTARLSRCPHARDVVGYLVAD